MFSLTFPMMTWWTTPYCSDGGPVACTVRQIICIPNTSLLSVTGLVCDWRRIHGQLHAACAESFTQIRTELVFSYTLCVSPAPQYKYIGTRLVLVLQQTPLPQLCTVLVMPVEGSNKIWCKLPLRLVFLHSCQLDYQCMQPVLQYHRYVETDIVLT